MKKGYFRRAGVAALASLTAVVGLVPLATGAGAATGFVWTRFGGADRYETARLVAQSRFVTADTVLLAVGDPFPDALAGNFLAGNVGAPILLTTKESLHAQARTGLANLRAKNVVILGGTDAVSAQVQTDLQNTTSTAQVGGPIVVRRVGGTDRFHTARLLATDSATTVGFVNGLRTAIVATGTTFPDALAGGPLAWAGKLPILLTEGGAATLNSNVAPALQSLNIQHVIVLGGESVIPASAVTAIQQARGGSPTITTVRLGGADRTETARLIADYAVSELGFSKTHVNLARGDDFPDALVGGPHGGIEKAPIILAVNPTTLSTSANTGAARYLSDNQPTLLNGDIFGGLLAISQAVEDQSKNIAGGGAAPGPITIPVTTVPQGATVSGTVSSPASVQTLSVSGCGLGNTNLTVGATGAFSFAIPASQGAGGCTLNFVVQRTGSQSEFQSVSLTVTGVTPTNTNAPDLLFAELTAGNTVTYKFDEPLAGAPPALNQVHVYSFTGIRQNPSNIAAIGDTLVAQFTMGQLTNATYASVERGAVQDAGGLRNPVNGAPLRNVTFQQGFTVAPDLLNVQNFVTDQFGNLFADFTFDAAVAGGQGNPPTGFGAARFSIILSDGREFFGLPGTDVIISADSRTVRVQISAGPFTVPVSQITRGAALTNAVQSAGGVPNPLQAVDVQAGGITTAPDLINALVTGTNQVSFIFDQPVDVFFDPGSPPCALPATAPGSFRVYDNNGTQTLSLNATRNSSDFRQVDVIFPAGIVGTATGASVASKTVLGTTGSPLQCNQQDSLPLQNVTFVPGRTSLPDLVQVRITLDAFNQPVVVYTFDSPILGGAAAALSANYRLYDENGFEFFPTGPANISGSTATFSVPNGNAFSPADAAAARAGGVNDINNDFNAPVTPLFPEGGAPVTRP